MARQQSKGDPVTAKRLRKLIGATGSDHVTNLVRAPDDEDAVPPVEKKTLVSLALSGKPSVKARATKKSTKVVKASRTGAPGSKHAMGNLKRNCVPVDTSGALSAESDTDVSVGTVPTRSQLIARLGRAILLPSEQCRHAIGGVRQHGRHLPDSRCREDSKVKPDDVTRDTRKFLPNHVQIFELFEKVIPLTHVQKFRDSLKLNHSKDLSGVGLESDKLCKTPIMRIDGTLRGAFGASNVSVSRCHNVTQNEEQGPCVPSDYFLEFTVMDCVLERSFKLASSTGVATKLDLPEDAVEDDDPVTHVLADYPEHLAQRHNYKFRTAIIVVPSAGLFYCARERRKETHGIANSHVQLDISWLRMKQWCGGGVNWFHNGGYVRHLSYGNENPVGKKHSPLNPSGYVGVCSVWKWRIKRAAFQLPRMIRTMDVGIIPPSVSQLMVYDAYQCPDDSGPRLPPDVFDGKDMSKHERARLRDMYNALLFKAASVRKHCRQYVRGCLYQKIPEGTWVIDPLKTPNVDVRVKIQYSDAVTETMMVKRECVVQIRYLPEIEGSRSLLQEVRRHAQMVAKVGGQAARSNCGDLGSMHPIGTRVMQNKKEGTYVSSTGDFGSLNALRGSVEASSMLALTSIPAVLRAIQDLETDSGVEYIPEMSGAGAGAGTPGAGTPGVGTPGVGIHRVSTTMDLSVNLANASHFDVNDASQGFSIWTEDEPGTTSDWYFVLPNVFGRLPGSERVYNGLAIALTHGVLIGWDGRVVRHCTSMMKRKSNVYGTFFAAKSKNIALGQRRCELELEERLRAKIVSVKATDAAIPEPQSPLNPDNRSADMVVLMSDDVVPPMVNTKGIDKIVGDSVTNMDTEEEVRLPDSGGGVGTDIVLEPHVDAWGEVPPDVLESPGDGRSGALDVVMLDSDKFVRDGAGRDGRVPDSDRTVATINIENCVKPELEGKIPKKVAVPLETCVGMPGQMYVRHDLRDGRSAGRGLVAGVQQSSSHVHDGRVLGFNGYNGGGLGFAGDGRTMNYGLGGRGYSDVRRQANTHSQRGGRCGRDGRGGRGYPRHTQQFLGRDGHGGHGYPHEPYCGWWDGSRRFGNATGRWGRGGRNTGHC